MKRRVAPFGDDLIRLRLIEERDLEFTLSWRNRDDARIWFKNSNLLSLDQHRAWYRQYWEKDDDFLFVIEAGNKLVGQASVYDIDWRNRRAEVGRFLAATGEGGKGYIKQACRILIHFCEESLGLTYLFLDVLEHNERARRVYEHSGFSEEHRHDGLVRMARFIDQTWHSSKDDTA